LNRTHAHAHAGALGVTKFIFVTYMILVTLFMLLKSILDVQQTLLRIVSPIEKAPIHMSLEEITVYAGHEVLMVDHLSFTYNWNSSRDFRPAAE
jgi:hypothetical protein